MFSFLPFKLIFKIFTNWQPWTKTWVDFNDFNLRMRIMSCIKLQSVSDVFFFCNHFGTAKTTLTYHPLLSLYGQLSKSLPIYTWGVGNLSFSLKTAACYGRQYAMRLVGVNQNSRIVGWTAKWAKTHNKCKAKWSWRFMSLFSVGLSPWSPFRTVFTLSFDKYVIMKILIKII